MTELSDTDLAAAAKVAEAYDAINWRAYLNEWDALCVVCDEGLPTADGFIRIDGVWIEFDVAVPTDSEEEES